MFSLHDGKTQARREEGGIVKIKLNLDCGAIHVAQFTAAEWCSLVTAVAEEADTSETHEKIKAIHGAW